MRQSVYIVEFVLVIFVMLSPHIDFIDLLNIKKNDAKGNLITSHFV